MFLGRRRPAARVRGRLSLSPLGGVAKALKSECSSECTRTAHWRIALHSSLHLAPLGPKRSIAFALASRAAQRFVPSTPDLRRFLERAQAESDCLGVARSLLLGSRRAANSQPSDLEWESDK